MEARYYMESKNLIESLEAIVNEVIIVFNEDERYLIENDLSERCICARFAIILTEVLRHTQYEEYVVDVEYNRGANGSERAIKRLCDDMIVVDLIVHRRGSNCSCGLNNLICIEMKKRKNRRGCEADENRLRKMTAFGYGFCYKIGIMLIIDDGLNVVKIKSKFSNGEQL